MIVEAELAVIIVLLIVIIVFLYYNYVELSTTQHEE